MNCEAKRTIEAITGDGSRWVDYDNGNYHVWLNLSDGTKIRYTEEDSFRPEFPESMDVKITNACDMGCKMCHEDSHPEGASSDISQAFLDTLHAGQEIAIGGGNVLSHPQLEELLSHLRDLGCIPSITVNQVHFMREFDRVRKLHDDDLVHGVGVSLSDPSQPGLIDRLHEIPTSVVHAIVGILSPEDVKALAGKGLKLLLLGYKQIRRGAAFVLDSSNQQMMRENAAWVASNLRQMMGAFDVLSFDNLALEQLPVRELVGGEDWERRYMGDDGTHTFYIDMVRQEFASSSASLLRYPIANRGVDEMFQVVLSEKNMPMTSGMTRDGLRALAGGSVGDSTFSMI